jgi:nicotinamidase/pyrazinamidase
MEETMIDPYTSLKTGDGLLIVDLQNDFCPGGALAIDEGDAVIPVLNAWTAAAADRGIPVYASRDWHPQGHVSFQSEGGPYPPHCVQDTPGARFAPELSLPPQAVIVTKGTRFDQDQNSVFDQTGFNQRLLRDGVDRLWIGGLAQDICVLATVLDARAVRLGVQVIQQAVRPVTPEGGRQALEDMRQAGAEIVS